jgi:hypothetical protein
MKFKVNFSDYGFISPEKFPLLEILLLGRKEVKEIDGMGKIEL